jgi:hypothetical protein
LNGRGSSGSLSGADSIRPANDSECLGFEIDERTHDREWVLRARDIWIGGGSDDASKEPDLLPEIPVLDEGAFQMGSTLSNPGRRDPVRRQCRKARIFHRTRMRETANPPDLLRQLDPRDVHNKLTTAKDISRGPVPPIAIECDVRGIGSDHGCPTLRRDVRRAVLVASSYQHDLTDQGGECHSVAAPSSSTFPTFEADAPTRPGPTGLTFRILRPPGAREFLTRW